MTGDGLSRGVSDMWRSVVLFLPTALAFIAILIIGYVLARLLRTVVAKALHRVGFDRAVEKGAVGRALRGSTITASDLCAKIAFYAALLFALQLAFGLWGPNAVSDLLTSLIAWLPRAFVAIVIIVVAAAIAGAAHDLISGALGGLSYGRLLARAASVLIISLGVIAALDQVRIATSVTQPLLIAVLATVAGVIIVGVGGGLIRPMSQRWDTWLDRAGTESAVIREHARAYAEERARLAAEAEAARLAEEARRAEEARLEEARRAEEKRLAEERAEQARRDEEERRKAEAARRAEEARLAEERRRADEARKAEEARLAEEAQQAEARAAAERAARDRAEEAQRRTGAHAAAAEETQVIAADETQVIAAEETQVIPVQEPTSRRRVTDTAFDLEPVDDRPHLIPGFDRGADDTTAEVQIPAEGQTQALPPADDTQVLPPDEPGPRKRR